MYMHILFEIFNHRLVNYTMKIRQRYPMNCMHYLVIWMLVSTLIVHMLSIVSSSQLSHAIIDVKPKTMGSLMQEKMLVLKMIITDIQQRSSIQSTLKTIVLLYLNANGLIQIDEDNTLHMSLILLVSIQVVKRIRKILSPLQLKCVKYFILTILASQTQIEKLSKDSIIDTCRISLATKKMWNICWMKLNHHRIRVLYRSK